MTLTKYFEQAWDPANLSKLHLVGLRIEDPKALPLSFDTADVGVRPKQDVLKLSLFLICLLDCFTGLLHYVIQFKIQNLNFI